MIVCPLHWYYDTEHLECVTAQMLVLGAPVLRGHHDAETGAFMLREGTHRIRAAHRLGLVPILKAIPWWRTKSSLRRARYAAAERGLLFDEVMLQRDPEK